MPDRSQSRFSSGERLGHFEIAKLLGAGGMGLVYEARDLRLGRSVALKVLAPERFANETARRRFLREARLAASIVHPNIATIHEVDEQQGHLFIAMELVPGSNLRDVSRSRSLTLDEILGVGIQVSDALVAAHRVGVIHRDVKPSNIMVTPDGQAKVLDFGLAKPLDGGDWEDSTTDIVVSDSPVERRDTPDSLSPSADGAPSGATAAGTTVGTPGYMSPEQWAGKRLDPRTDLFSLGVVLYETTAGSLPFDGATERDIAVAVATAEPKPLHEIREDVPMAFSNVVHRCLAKPPDERYADAIELHQSLIRVRSEIRERPTLFDRIVPGFKMKAIVATVAFALISGFAALNLVPSHESVDAQPTRLAVLPFRNLSGNSNLDYFSEGMTDQLITRLSQIPALRVISRQSVMQFQDADMPLSEISSNLGGVDSFVSGSVVISEDTVRANIQLADSDGTIRIAREYERSLGGVLELQRELAHEIVATLELALSPRAQERLQLPAGTVHPEAYRLYTRGRSFWNRRTLDDYHTAIDYFSMARELDENFAQVHAALADAYVLVGPSPSPSGDGRTYGYDDVKAAAERALRLDPGLGEAHAALAFAEYYLQWNWAEADERFQRALELSPSYATAHHWYADFLAAMGRTEEALAEIQSAFALDPLSKPIQRDRAWGLFMAGRYQEAIVPLEDTLRRDRTFLPARTLLGRAYAHAGRHEEAIDLLSELVTTHGPEERLEMLGEAFAVAGRREEAEAVLQQLTSQPDDRSWPYAMALILVALDRHEDAIEWLWIGYEKRDRTLVNLNADRRFDPLEPYDRFAQLIARMRFPNPRVN